MNPETIIEILKDRAPAILNPTLTFDMGAEFTILAKNGVIFQQPGMLLDYSGGQIPFSDEMTSDEFLTTINDLASTLEEYLIPYEKIDSASLDWLLDCIESSGSQT